MDRTVDTAPVGTLRRLRKRFGHVSIAVLLVLAFFRGSRSQDVHEYARYALAFAAHPFARWPVEYPPAAVAVMVPAALSPLAFAFAMLAMAAIVWRALALDCRPAAQRWLTWMAAGATLTALGRYDLVPTACALCALLCAERRRWTGAWGLSLAGACLKWFPAMLWPLLLIAEWHETGRWRWDRATLSGALFAASYGLAWLGAGGHAWSSIGWFLHRPIEVESLAASVLVLVGHSLQVVHSFRSENLVGRGTVLIQHIMLAAQVVGQVVVWGLFVRRRVTLREAATLAMTWLVAVGSVLSAQYLMWVLPFWALTWPSLRLGRWPLVVSLATTVVYPVFYFIDRSGAMWPAMARNLLLLLLVAVGVQTVWRRSQDDYIPTDPS